LGNAERINNGEATHLQNCVILTYMIRQYVTLFIHTDATIRSQLSVTLISAEKDRSLVFIYLFLVYVTPATQSA
jgi:hypothetical protein